LFHLVDDRFLVAQILYLLDPSSATRFFIFLMADWGQLSELTNFTWGQAFFIAFFLSDAELLLIKGAIKNA